MAACLRVCQAHTHPRTRLQFQHKLIAIHRNGRGLDYAAGENQHRAFRVHLRRGRPAMRHRSRRDHSKQGAGIRQDRYRRHRQTRLRITYAAITAPSSRVSNGTKRASGIPVAMAAAREEDLASGCAIGSATPPSGQSAPCAWGELYAQGFPPPACVLPCCCEAATISSAMACGASTLSISSRLDSPEVSIEMSPTPSMR